MNDRVYIDGIDIKSRFGVVVPSGGFDELFLFPPLKEPKKNNWPEHDGIEVDLETPVLNAKEIAITFVLINRSMDVGDFIFFLSEPGYRTIHVFGRSWKLRLTEGKNNTIWENASKFTLIFTDDNPTQENPVSYTPGTHVENSGYWIDNVQLNTYGIVVMEGMDELLKAPATKKNLLRNLIKETGQEYDAAAHYFNSKEVTFKCCLIASDMTRFWNCYDAFFRDLTNPEERLLYLDQTGEDYPCYYKETGDFKIVSLSPVVSVTFSLTLVFTVFRIGQAEYLLAAESGEYLVLEDDTDGDIFIDLKDL